MHLTTEGHSLDPHYTNMKTIKTVSQDFPLGLAGGVNIAPCVRRQHWSPVRVWEKQRQKALSPSSVLTRPVLTLATRQSLPGDR